MLDGIYAGLQVLLVLPQLGLRRRGVIAIPVGHRGRSKRIDHRIVRCFPNRVQGLLALGTLIDMFGKRFLRTVIQ